MNRRELIKYGIGTVVGVTATKVLGSSIQSEPEILNYVEDRTPFIICPEFIAFGGYIYSDHPKTNTSILLTTDINKVDKYWISFAEFVGIVHTEFNSAAVEWIKYRKERVVLAWNKRTHSRMSKFFEIKSISPFSLSQEQSSFYSYASTRDPYFIIREETDTFVPAKKYFKGLQ